MSEKRFICGLGFPINSDDPIRIISDSVEDKDYYKFSDICNVLNEQQELIEELHISDHMGWGRAEKFEKELKQKKIYIKRLEYKVQKFKEMNGEQQATINELTKNRDRWRELAKLHNGYFNCLEKAIEKAYEEKPYPKIEDIMDIYSELEKEFEDE